MIRLAALALLFSFGLTAQGPPSDRVVVEVKHLRGPRLEQAVRLLSTFLQPGNATSYPELNAIVLRGAPESVSAAEALLKKFDVPAPAGSPSIVVPQTVQVRIYMVQGADDGQSGTLPSEIAPAVEQMKKSFVYKSYRLIDTVIMQGQLGKEVNASGLMPQALLQHGLYQVSIRELQPAEDGKALQLKRFFFNIRVPLRVTEKDIQYADANVSSDLTIRFGQKLVVGKLSALPNGNTIFLILTAEPTA
jgi:hypothetical protein